MNTKKFNRYVLCYDIPNTKRRNKVINHLEDYGFRVQQSVFEAVLDKRLYEELLCHIQRIIKPKEDSFFAYPLCLSCEEKIFKTGIGSKNRDKGRESYFII